MSSVASKPISPNTPSQGLPCKADTSNGNEETGFAALLDEIAPTKTPGERVDGSPSRVSGTETDSPPVASAMSANEDDNDFDGGTQSATVTGALSYVTNILAALAPFPPLQPEAMAAGLVNGQSADVVSPVTGAPVAQISPDADPQVAGATAVTNADTAATSREAAAGNLSIADRASADIEAVTDPTLSAAAEWDLKRAAAAASSATLTPAVAEGAETAATPPPDASAADVLAAKLAATQAAASGSENTASAEQAFQAATTDTRRLPASQASSAKEPAQTAATADTATSLANRPPNSEVAVNEPRALDNTSSGNERTTRHIAGNEPVTASSHPHGVGEVTVGAANSDRPTGVDTLGVAAVDAAIAMQRAASMPVAPTTVAGDGPRTAAVPISDLGVEIVARANEGSNRFDIRLDPPELGRIHVQLDVDRDGNVASRLIVDRSETLDLLRRDSPALERALQSAGLKTGDGGLSFTLREHGGQPRSPFAGSEPVATKQAAEETAAIAAVSSYGRWTGVGSGVDISV